MLDNSTKLVVNNIQARLNLNARVASLVNLTAGVSVSISTVQLKILGKKKLKSKIKIVFCLI